MSFNLFAEDAPRTRSAPLALVLLALVSASASAQTTANWVSATSGPWTNAALWSTNPAFPNNTGGSAFNAVIGATGSAYTVTLDQNISLSSLNVSSPDATLDLTGNTLTINGTYMQSVALVTGAAGSGLNFVGGMLGSSTANTMIRGVSMLRNTGQLSIVGTGITDICDTGVDNGGETSWAGAGTLRFGGNTVFTNRATGVLRLQGSGLFTRNAGGPPGTPVINNGGSIIKDAGGTTTLTTITLNNTGLLRVSAGTLTTDSVQLTNNTLAGGRWQVASGANLDLQGQTILTNSADVQLSGAGSSFAAFNSVQTNAAGGKITVDTGRNFTTAGQFTNTGSLTVGAGTTFAVAAGSSFTNYNAGTRTLTGGTLAVTGQLRFDNIGVQTLAADVTLTGAASDIQTSAGASALTSLGIIGAGGKLTIASGRDFTTSADFGVLAGGQLVVGTGQRFRVAAGSSLTNIAGGVFNDAGFTLQGILQADNANITTIGTNFTLDGAGAGLQNASGQNGLSTLNSITSAGTFGIRGGQQLTLNAGLGLAGNLRVGGGAAAERPLERGAGTVLTLNGNLVQTGGTFTLGGGELRFLSGGYVLQAGTVTGGGTITGPATIGAAGRAALTIGSTTFDTLAVTGALAFDGGAAGVLQIIIDTAGPSMLLGQTFDILTYGSRSGGFATIEGLSQSGYTLAVTYTDVSGGPGAVRVSVIAIPAPGAVALLLVGGLAAARRRR